MKKKKMFVRFLLFELFLKVYFFATIDFKMHEVKKTIACNEYSITRL